MNRGYAGFYKEHYLRSSYEYAYAKFLDYYSIPWEYEVKVFDLGYKIYKPDFFVYGENNKLLKIVEVKSRDKNAQENAIKALRIIENEFNISCELVSYKELMRLYEDLPFSLTSTIEEWIKSEDTTINKAAFGELNGHFNLRHSDEAKKKIGEHTKSLWSTNSFAKKRMLEGLRKSGLVQKGKHKVPRVIRNCHICGVNFEVRQSSTQKFCSRSCTGNNAIKIATKTYVDKRNQIHKDIKNFVIQWTLENKELVLNTPLNKIKPTITPMIACIHEKFGVKDLRIISKAIFGKDLGRKELLKFMQKVCNENVC
ncbi:restriction endonuclease [Lysinibacillus sp. BW-2-10]|nr:restriction endonuclease [Lysinibacillus sp. BW-2-10]